MILLFPEIDLDDLPRAGGKGANLGSLARAGFPVPDGFCVTTEGFTALVRSCAAMPRLYDALDALSPDDVAGARRLAAEVRAALESTPLPQAVCDGAIAAWQRLETQHAYAVRSSATAEDLPDASFAGQQETYLNVRGEAALLDAIRRCFASLFTDRAILYRARNGFGHRGVSLSVVVQRMVHPEAAGILFTADPVTGHRGTMTIDAGFGLGEALVSGLVTADLYRLDKQTGALKELRIGDKAIAIRSLPEGGTITESLSDEKRHARVLSDAALRELYTLGKKVEAHRGGQPQDIEWCLDEGKLYLVQARPITSLYPLPSPVPHDGALHVYVSFSHAQNMIEPLSPLGADLWRTFLPFGKSDFEDLLGDESPVKQAGGRLYLDVSSILRVNIMQRGLLRVLGGAYPEIAARLKVLADRPEMQAGPRVQPSTMRMILRLLGPLPPRIAKQLFWNDPEEIPAWINRFVEERATEFRTALDETPAGAPRLREARRRLLHLFEIVPLVMPKLISGVVALAMLRKRFAGTPHAADVEALQRGLFGNITTEMDLQVGDLADLARPYPELCAQLRSGVRDPAALQSLRSLPGGAAFMAAFEDFLQRFGMRGQAEIDIARPRWIDRPVLLLNSVAGNLSLPEAGAHRAHFKQLQSSAAAAGDRLVAATDGTLAKRWVQRLVRCVRYGLGMREHPKYLIILCFAALRKELLDIAAALVARGRLPAAPDLWLLTIDEVLEQLESTTPPDVRPLLAARKQDQERARHLSPPLVVTSEGETPELAPPKDLPPGALSGLGASAGVIEGVAHVVLDPAAEVLQAGEILVAPYTDPGWTPLFVHAAGLVCDVGGMMTHGSVIAREYGIPAVVGTREGTRRIKTGQRLRVDGSRGMVEVVEVLEK